MSPLNELPLESLDLFSIRDAREGIGITLTALADMAGISKAYLSYVERGEMKPSDEVKRDILQALKRAHADRTARLKRVRAAVDAAFEEPGLVALLTLDTTEQHQ